MTRSAKLFLFVASVVMIMSLSAGLVSIRDARADSDAIANGNFESGGLSGWTVGGIGASVEVLGKDDFEPEILPPEGDRFVLLTTGPGEVNLALGFDLDMNTFPDNDTATMAQTFTLLSYQVPANLSFQWNFLSAEVDGHDDFFMVTLNGAIVLAGSVPGAQSFVSPLPDVPTLDGVTYSVTSNGPADGSIFDGGSCGFHSFSYVINTPGTYNLQFVVSDQEDRFFDSGLLIDAVRLALPPPPPLPSQVEQMPTAATAALVESMTTANAAITISQISIDKVADIVEAISLTKAADIMQILS
ncbi:MAG: hypothetical protein WC560_12050, partial [Syntrophales bacterium]